MTIATPGWSVSFVLKTFLHSSSLSIVYFSEMSMVAIISLVFSYTIATSCPTLISSSSEDRVIGIGQKVPFSSAMLWQTLNQSALFIKPSRGVNPPIPNMMTSPNSLDEQIT